MFCLPKNFNYVKLITLIKTAKIYLISKLLCGHVSASAVSKLLCGHVSASAVSKLLCGCSTSVVRGLPKPRRRVRLPSPAPFFYQLCWEGKTNSNCLLFVAQISEGISLA